MPLYVINDSPFITSTPSGDDAGVIVTGQFSVGTPTNPKETVLGGGDSYPVPTAYTCHSDNTIGMVITSAIDVSEILQSEATSNTGLFGGTTAGSFLLVGSDTKFHGAKAKMAALGDIGSGSLTGEFLRTTDDWVNASFMVTDAEFPFEQRGKEIATCVSCSEQWRFGFDPDDVKNSTWQKVALTVNGVTETKYWSRFIIVTDITTDIGLEQLKLHTDRLEINANGFTEYFGSARYSKSIPIQLEGNTDKTPLNEDLKVASGITVSRINNEFANGKVDGMILSGIVPEGLDTSIPLQLHVSWYVTNDTAGDIELEVELIPIVEGFVFDGTATPVALAPIVHSVVNDQEAVHTSVFKTLVQNSLPGQQVFTSLFRDATAGNTDDTFVGNIVITNVVLVGYFWKP